MSQCHIRDSPFILWSVEVRRLEGPDVCMFRFGFSPDKLTLDWHHWKKQSNKTPRHALICCSAQGNTKCAALIWIWHEISCIRNLIFQETSHHITLSKVLLWYSGFSFCVSRLSWDQEGLFSSARACGWHPADTGDREQLKLHPVAAGM